MSDLVLIRKSERAAEMQPAPVKPTIIIGIGGSGGNIQLRIRKRFFERYGSLMNFPIVSYLWLDTDTTEKDVGAGLFAEQIRFSLPEKLMTTMADTSKVTSDLNQYPHVKSWFYPGLAKLKTMTEGAGQIRAYSRLGFFEHYDKIKNALVMAGNNVRSVDNSRAVWEKHRMEVNPADLQIFVIFSVAGGTGSGMFLDLSFLLKEVFRGEASTVGWVLMPGLFNPNEDRIFANGYAALKEMEHFSYENDFKVEWPDRVPRELPGPPFNYTYLIDRSNQAKHEVTFASHEKIFNMIADNIFKDFTQSDFAGYKRGVRVNLDQYLYDQYAFTHKDERGESLIDQRWITRYSSFGLASITVPADRIELACSYKLAAAVVDHWGSLSDEGYDAASLTETVLYEVFPAIGIYEGSFEIQGKVEQRHDLQVDLLDAHRKTSMLNLIIQEVGDATREAREEVHKDQGMTLAQYLRNSVDKILTKLRRRNDPQQSGDYARAIYFNKEDKIVDVQKKLHDEIARLINEHHQSTGYAISLLRQVINVLRDETREYIPAFARGRDQARKNAEENRYRLDHKLDEIARHEERHNLDLRKGAILRHDIDTFEEIASEYLQNEIVVQVREASREVCEKLIGYIGAAEKLDNDEIRQEGLMGELYALGSQLVSLKQDLENKYRYFREKPTTSDLSVMLYEPEDIEKIYYPRQLGAEQAKQTIVGIGDQILQEFGTTVLNLPKLVRERGIEQIEQQICDLCRTPFQTIKRDFDVLELLWKNCPSEAERIAKIREVYSAAKFWLRGGSRPRSFSLTAERIKILVGVPQDNADPSKLAEFKRLLESKVRAPEDPAISIQNLSDRSEIVFYTEVGGIPINWADNISQMREKYNLKQTEGEELHTDCNEIKFQDLVVLDDRERRDLEDAHECFLLGLIFGKIKPEKDGYDRIRYLWSEQVGFTTIERQVPLGIEMRALTELINRRSMRENILKQAQEEVERVRQDRDQLARFNALLDWYYVDVYPETRIQGSDGVEYREQNNLCRAVHKQINQLAMFLRSQPGFDRQVEEEFRNKTKQYRGSLDAFTPKLIDGRRAFQFTTASSDGRKL